MSAPGPRYFLSTLTDDMFVVNSPSLTIPFVYEKPSTESLKNFVNKLGKSVQSPEEETKSLEEQAKNESSSIIGEKGDFNTPVGKFFMDIGMSLAQEHVERSLLRTHRLKLNKEYAKDNIPMEKQMVIESFAKHLEISKEKNEPYRFNQKRCKFCSFKTESALVMHRHLETPHQEGNNYKCNFCPFEVSSTMDIVSHVIENHNTTCSLDHPPALHSCPICPYESNVKRNRDRHIVNCEKSFQSNSNQEPKDWIFPAKLPKSNNKQNLSSKLSSMGSAVPANKTSYYDYQKNSNSTGSTSNELRVSPVAAQISTVPKLNDSQCSLSNKSMNDNSFTLNSSTEKVSSTTKKNVSIQNTYITCEICDGILRDLKDLRVHMNVKHKIRIHPKLLVVESPIKCPKCGLRFFTDAGLERHIVKTHKMITSRLHEAAQNNKDAGDCPICRLNFEANVLSHIIGAHNVSSKTISISYKCKLCSINYDLYKEFEKHIYSTHGKFAKKNGKKNTTDSSAKPAYNNNVGNNVYNNS